MEDASISNDASDNNNDKKLGIIHEKFFGFNYLLKKDILRKHNIII